MAGFFSAASLLIGGWLKILFGMVANLWAWLCRRSPAQLACLALAIVAIVLVLDLRAEKRHLAATQHRLELADDANAKDCAAAALAAGNPKLDCRRAAEQIRALGEGLAQARAAIEKQNAAVNALASKSAAQQASAAIVIKRAQDRARDASAVAQRLRASSGKAGDPCVPSSALIDAWK